MYGSMESTVVLYSYKSKEAMEATEPKPKVKASSKAWSSPRQAPPAAGCKGRGEEVIFQ